MAWSSKPPAEYKTTNTLPPLSKQWIKGCSFQPSSHSTHPISQSNYLLQPGVRGMLEWNRAPSILQGQNTLPSKHSQTGSQGPELWSPVRQSITLTVDWQTSEYFAFLKDISRYSSFCGSWHYPSSPHLHPYSKCYMLVSLLAAEVKHQLAPSHPFIWPLGFLCILADIYRALTLATYHMPLITASCSCCRYYCC